MRIVTVINKWWECEPAIAAMLNSNAWPSGDTNWPEVLNSPLQRPSGKTAPWLKPRAVFQYNNFQLEIWCVSDLLNDLSGVCQRKDRTVEWARPMLQSFEGGKPIFEGTERTQNTRLGRLIGSYMAAKSLYLH